MLSRSHDVRRYVILEDYAEIEEQASIPRQKKLFRDSYTISRKL